MWAQWGEIVAGVPKREVGDFAQPAPEAFPCGLFAHFSNPSKFGLFGPYTNLHELSGSAKAQVGLVRTIAKFVETPRR